MDKNIETMWQEYEASMLPNGTEHQKTTLEIFFYNGFDHVLEQLRQHAFSNTREFLESRDRIAGIVHSFEEEWSGKANPEKLEEEAWLATHPLSKPATELMLNMLGTEPGRFTNTERHVYLAFAVGAGACFYSLVSDIAANDSEASADRAAMIVDRFHEIERFKTTLPSRIAAAMGVK